MKAVQGNIYKVARVVLNSSRKDRNQWAKIVVDDTVRHTGQTTYIKRIAKERYNLNVNI